jgi:hypothetical protein
MRTSHKINKKIFLAVALIALSGVAGAIVFTAFAVSRNTTSIENNIKVATNGVKIVENSVSGFGQKEVSFLNDGAESAPVLLRIAYSETWTNSDGTIVSNLSGNNNVVAKTWTTAFVNDFADGGDGWYYYKKVLNPETSVQVLSAIALSDSTYSKYNYDLAFRFESVQADATAANTLWGKTATIGNDGSVTWQ